MGQRAGMSPDRGDRGNLSALASPWIIRQPSRFRMEVKAPMPLYELVLRYEDREETRLTGRPLSIGETLQIGYDEWRVVLEREPSDVRVTAAFVCELTKVQRARAEKMRADDAERRERIDRLAVRQERIDRDLPS